MFASTINMSIVMKFDYVLLSFHSAIARLQ